MLGNPAVRFSALAGSVTGGTATAYTITSSPVLTALYNNAVVSARIYAANTGAATLAVDGLPAKPIRKLGNVALAPGDLPTDSIAVFVFNAALDAGAGVWLLASAPAPVWDVYATAIGAGSPTVYALTAAVAPPSYVTGMRIRFAADVANTGAAQVNLNTLGAVALKKAANVALATNDLKLGQVVEAVHDGTNFQLAVATAQAETTAYTSDERALAAIATAEEFTHLLAAIPTSAQALLACQSAELNYAVGDEVEASNAQGAGDNNWCIVSRNATLITVSYDGTTVIQLRNRTTGGLANITKANWKLKVRARL